MLGSEYVIAVEGTVAQRTPETVNAALATGEVELVATKLWILNESRTPPFPMEETVDVKEDARLKYRYVDLRRPHMQRNIILRSKISFAVREFLYGQGFLEIETPFMTRSTPEGARDYLVPSRVQPGSFYALPQSPQIFKQLLMVSGYEKYFQIVRCFRDEDLRADRQPEFTQIDLEMSFPQQERVYEVVEPMMQRVFEVAGFEVAKQFPRLTYAQAMRSYGSDKPDLRLPPFHVLDGESLATGLNVSAGGDPYSEDGRAEPQGTRRTERVRNRARAARLRRSEEAGCEACRTSSRGVGRRRGRLAADRRMAWAAARPASRRDVLSGLRATALVRRAEI